MWKALEASTLLRENIFALFGENKAGRKKGFFEVVFHFIYHLMLELLSTSKHSI